MENQNFDVSQAQTITNILLWGLSILGAVIGTMAIYIVRQQKTIIILARDSTAAITKMNLVVEGNTDVTNEVKNLLHSANSTLLEIKFNGRK